MTLEYHLSPVYTIQPAVKQRFDNRLYRVNGALQCITWYGSCSVPVAVQLTVILCCHCQKQADG